MDHTHIIQCPHCSDIIIIDSKDINCGIFRHAVYRTNLQQLNPHASELECKSLVDRGSILGCGKPFQVTRSLSNPSELIVNICDYI